MSVNSVNYYKKKLILFLLLKSFLIIILMLFVGLGLGPDEAQYWTWSQKLDWGYYSKPPAIAWQIKLGTFLWGNTELGVRFFSIVIAFAQALAIYHLALACHLISRAAFWCALVMAFCPIGIFGAFFAITDGGMLLCWTFASLILVQAIKKSTFPSVASLGFCILMGALFKWSIFILWLYIAVFYLYYYPLKSWYKSFLLAFCISLMGLLPSLWWNWSHDWATFRHVMSSTMQVGSGTSKGNFFEFVGSQALLFSPIFFVLLLASYKVCLKKFKTLFQPICFCFLLSFGSLVLFSTMALFQKMQGNWIVFTYPTSIILVGWYCFEVNCKAFKWLKIGLIFTLFLSSLMFLWPVFSVNHRKSPFKHNLGWLNMREALKQTGYDPQKNFLVSDRYQTTSLLSFYSEGQKRAYFLNLEGHRKNQFSYWPQFQKEEKEKTGYFVWVENAPHLETNWQNRQQFYQKELLKYFEQVETLDLMPLLQEKQQMVKGMLVFKCQNCKEIWPDEIQKY